MGWWGLKNIGFKDDDKDEDYYYDDDDDRDKESCFSGSTFVFLTSFSQCIYEQNFPITKLSEFSNKKIDQKN